jgi:hypothetical protein
MSKGGYVRIFLSAALLLGATSCADPMAWTPPMPAPPPGELILSNNRFDHVAVEAVVTAAPDCTAADPAAPALAFNLPYKGTHVVAAAPAADICWRLQTHGGQWSEWNRAFTASGRHVDMQL